jgi:formylglycine-generating enzyme required for sulfatase activity
MRLEAGRTLGDWQLLKHLGAGPLGLVFFAEHRFTKKKATLKILPEELAADRAFLARFEDEVSQIALLEHPSITKTYNVSFVDGVYFLATECVVDANQETKTLAQYFGGRRATQQEVLKVAEQIASALDYAHSQKFSGGKGFAHGNLKPNNIMVTESQGSGVLVKIADFGLFRVIGAGNVLLRSYKAAIEQLSLQDTLFTARVGQDRYPTTALETKQYEELLSSLAQNIQFLSPEQRKGDWSEPVAADIWAFGVLVYWMVTGEFPEGVWDQNLRQTAVADWSGVVKACLDLQPQRRPVVLTKLLSTTEPADTAAKKLPIVFQQPAAAKAEAVQDKLVKEYSPEKRDPKGITPVLTDMTLIREGVYQRGSNQGCRDEIPRHPVRIASFFIDVHPVTNEQFVRFLDFLGDEKDYQNHDIIRLKDSRIKKSAGKFSIERGYGKHPVVGVTWYGATAYAHWIGKRLPTEAEWEVACCGTLENPMYPTGEDIEKTQANFFSSDTTPVKSYPPNGHGIYDMAGNVYEWCLDWYEYNYYEHSVLEPDFPKGPVQGVYRVLRGGCWKSLKEDLRCSKRHRNNPGAANGTYGFRCVQDAPEDSSQEASDHNE